MTISTLTQIMKIERKDGVTIGLTEFSNDLAVEGLVYKAQGAIDPSNVTQAVNLSTDNTEVRLLISNGVITVEELMSGVYDEAEVTIALVNFIDIPATLDETLILLRGRVGEVSATDDDFGFELRSFSELLGKAVNKQTSPLCPWIFGDSRCKFDLVANNLQATDVDIVSTGVAPQILNLNTSIITDRFISGRLVFKTGSNAPLIYEIVEVVAPSQVTILGELVGIPQPGDLVDITAYCDKTQDTCKDTYNNYINFGGIPVGGNFVPGLTRITVLPD